MRGFGAKHTRGTREAGGRGRAYHLVNSLHDLEHLVVADLAVAVNVVELERPVELVLHLAPGRDAQRADELLKVDGPGFIAVKHVEHIICETRRVAEREELPVDFLELVLGEHARWAVLEEACALSRAPAYCQPPIRYFPSLAVVWSPLPIMVWRGVLRACHTASRGSWVSPLLRHQELDLSGDIGDKFRIEDEDGGSGATTVGGHEDGDVTRGGNEIVRTLVPLLQLLLVKVC